MSQGESPLLTHTIDAAFPVHGDRIPVDHGEALYVALSRLPQVGPWLRAATSVGIAPIPGREADEGDEGAGLIALTADSRLTLRLSAAELPNILPLSGQSLVVDGHRIDIGPPSVLALKSEPELYAHRVAIRGGEDPARFDAGIRRQLDELEIRAEPIRGERRLLRLGDHAIVTHGLTVTALSDEDSLHLQEAGLGGRRKMGCGVFVRPNEEASLHRGGSWRRRENGGDV